MKESYLTIYDTRSVLNSENGDTAEFEEGKVSDGAKLRIANIRKALESGFLEEIIKKTIDQDVEIDDFSPEHLLTLRNLVDSVTSEVGRAIIGLTVLQLTIKSIEPTQSIRLHKASNSSKSFSWKEGIPMRTIDQNYITPVLRKFNLLKLNSFGFMMTRTLAENYPYTKLYKAGIRGAKGEWVKIVEWLESGELNPLEALKLFVALLHNRSENFLKLSNELMINVSEYNKAGKTSAEIRLFLTDYIQNSNYSARLFEIAIHSFFQVIVEMDKMSCFLKPLSQMRSANKKHGNIGDIELTKSEGRLDIVEAWDAKYGKTYFRDELEEINDKLRLHPDAELVGIISDKKPDVKDEITRRISDLEELHGVLILIMSFDDWIDFQLKDFEIEDLETFHRDWLTEIAKYICQLKRDIAPIDEPTYEWVKELNEIINSKNMTK